MAISCVYCGGQHDSPDDVRSCWQRSEAGNHSVPPADETTSAPRDTLVLPDRPPGSAAGIDSTRATHPAAAAPGARSRQAASEAVNVARRGPAELGRNVVVATDAPTPREWLDAPRVTVDYDTVVAHPDERIVQLRRHAQARTGLVIELDAGARSELDAAREQTDDEAPSKLGARFTFRRAELAHLVWSNAAVADHDGTPRWRLIDDAVTLGASIPHADAAGDVVTRAGIAMWLDGGPVRFTAPIDGVPVLHRVAVEHGSLRAAVTNDTAADLAPDQLAAVTHDGGAARIIAPAGSGKTRVLTERARHLLTSWSLPPSAVCLVAFNKRAQEEMRMRTSDLPGLQVRTLNAIALAIANGTPPFAPRPTRLRTIDEGEVRRLIGDLVSFPRKRNSDPVAPWIEALSLARLGLRDPAEVEALYDGEVDGFADVLPRYRARLARAGAVDFDEQIQVAIELLLRDPQARLAAQHACRVLLVDEFQDLTPAHLLLVRLLAGPEAAVFGVGDDDQTIYGYNGADPGWLIDFGGLFPGSGDHPLEVNYRCPEGVVAAADMLLRHNRRRVVKVIRAGRLGEHGWAVSTSDDPVGAAVGAVQHALSEGRAPAEIAVLTRVNSLLAPVQVALNMAGVAVSGGVGPEFLERASVRAALAWLRLACTRGANLASADLAEALRRPARPLHPNVARWVGEQSSIDGLRRLADRLTTEREAERVGAFASDIERLQRAVAGGGTTDAVIATLRDGMGLAATVATLDVHRHGMNRAAQSDDLVAVAELARLQPDPHAFEAWLRDALRRPPSTDAVTLATVHRVKGQEWPVVVVHHADADQFPHRLADDREEERRLFHVAITRGGHSVTIVTGDQPSKFVAELTTEPSASGEAEWREAQQPRQPASAVPVRPADQLQGGDAALFEELRTVRRHLAAGKPAYTVVADATLAAIAESRPGSLDELARIRGIGPSKLEQYGAALLAAVEGSTT